MLSLITPTVRKDYTIKNLLSFVSFDRLKKKDYLVNFESSVIKEYKFAAWDLYFTLEEDKSSSLRFLKEEKREYSIQQFLSLPLVDSEDEFYKVYDLWNPLYNENYYIDTGCDRERVNFPNGYVGAKIMFVGEAPGWKEDLLAFKVPIYSYGKTSLLFRYLARVVFGSKIWFTNLFKGAISENKKPSGDKLFAAKDYLSKEYDIIKPDIVICLGGYVYDNLNFINKFKIYHPSYIFRKGNNLRLYAEDMMKTRRMIYG